MTDTDAILQLQDIDLLRAELSDAAAVARLRRVGFEVAGTAALDKARERMVAALDPRWQHHYERALARYGRAVAIVRARVCQGCFITLPTSAAPSGDDALTLCESCGRLLYWR
jgi:predicted  nucleic acid-binding Zn-ribbon protein